MAIIQTLRNKAGKLLVGLLALSIVGFIFMDMQGQGGQGGPQQIEAGTIDGKTVTPLEHERKWRELLAKDYIYQNRPFDYSYSSDQEYQFKVQAWNALVRDRILETQYSKLGISLSDEEQKYLISGNNPHEEIKRIYVKEPGAPFDPVWFQSYLQQLQSAQPQNQDQAMRIQREQAMFQYLVDDISSSEKLSKYQSLINSAAYVPTWMAHDEFAKRNHKVSGSYILIPFESVSASEIEVTDEDLMAYYEETKYKYRSSNDNRSIEYVTFPVIPSKEDSASTKATVSDLVAEFAKGEEDSTFATIYTSSEAPYIAQYRRNVDLTHATEQALLGTASGTMSEVYYHNNFYSVSKVISQDRVSDSIKWKHIFIGATNVRPIDSCHFLADSIMEALKNGANFAALATQYSDDQASAGNGGEMDWLQFENSVFPTVANNRVFTENQGETFKMVSETRNAYGVQIINIQQAKRNVPAVKLATVSLPVEPGTKTVQEQEQKAQRFSEIFGNQGRFDSGVVEMGLNKRIASNISPEASSIAGLPNVRTVVTWAYTNEKDACKYFDLQGEQDQFVVARIVSATNQGEFQDFENVKEGFRAQVVNRKKAEKIMAQIQETPNAKLPALAAKFKVGVKDVRNVLYSGSAFGPEGSEPKVVGTMFGLTNTLPSKPIEGNKGVYVLVRNQDSPAAEAKPEDIKKEVARLQRVFAPNIEAMVFELMRIKGSKNQTYNIF